MALAILSVPNKGGAGSLCLCCLARNGNDTVSSKQLIVNVVCVRTLWIQHFVMFKVIH